MAGCYRVNSPQVIHEELDGEVVVIDLGSGIYYSLREVAAAIWVGVSEGMSGDDLVALLEGAYDGADADVSALTTGFITDLEQVTLIVPDGSAAASQSERALALISESSEFVPPVLEQFSDMQDLILLDPVHDVDVTQGWPHAPEDTSG